MSFRSRPLQREMSRSRQALNRSWFAAQATAPPEARRSARSLLVVQTYAVDGPPGMGVSHYELHLAADDDLRTNRLIVLTFNEDVYTVALRLEGKATRVDASYHPSKRPDGSTCLLLDALEVRP